MIYFRAFLHDLIMFGENISYSCKESRIVS